MERSSRSLRQSTQRDHTCSGKVPSPGHELVNPSDKIVRKVLKMAKICVVAAAPRCKHLCGIVDDKMEARPLAGVRPASGCGSYRCGNLEALSGVFSLSNDLPCLHDSCVDCGACRVSHSVCCRSNDQRAASTSCTVKSSCSCYIANCHQDSSSCALLLAGNGWVLVLSVLPLALLNRGCCSC